LKWLLALILLFLSIGTLRIVGCSFYCASDSDCDDSNDCTRDFCRSMRWSNAPYEFSCFGDDGWSYWCEHEDVEDGTPCALELEIGICDAGVCQLEEEEPEAAFDMQR
jgi:hypothetical protein